MTFVRSSYFMTEIWQVFLIFGCSTSRSVVVCTKSSLTTLVCDIVDDCKTVKALNKMIKHHRTHGIHKPLVVTVNSNLKKKIKSQMQTPHSVDVL